MATCYIPQKYRCFTFNELESHLSVALCEHIEAEKMTAADIFKRYPSIRAGHLEKLRNGEPLGLKMLTALSEATGMRFNLEIVK